MRIAIDSDSNGRELKRILIELLKEKAVDYTDLDFLRTHQDKDYPDVAFNLATGIQKEAFDRGILICGTGQGMAMSANKVQGIYAGAASDVYAAERLVKSNNAQVLALGALITGNEAAKTIVSAWLASEFQGGRSQSKVDRMHKLEAESFNK